MELKGKNILYIRNSINILKHRGVVEVTPAIRVGDYRKDNWYLIYMRSC